LFPGVKRPYLYGMIGGLEGQSAEVRKKSSPQVFDPRTVQPAAFHYTDRSILAHISFLLFPQIAAWLKLVQIKAAACCNENIHFYI